MSGLRHPYLIVVSRGPLLIDYGCSAVYCLSQLPLSNWPLRIGKSLFSRQLCFHSSIVCVSNPIHPRCPRRLFRVPSIAASLLYKPPSISTFYNSFLALTRDWIARGIPPKSSCQGLATKITEFSWSSQIQRSVSYFCLSYYSTVFQPPPILYSSSSSSTRQAVSMSSPPNIISIFYPIWSVDHARIYAISHHADFWTAYTQSPGYN